jgi:hypothetical protein
VSSRGLRLVDADAEDACRFGFRVYLAAEVVGVPAVEESGYEPGVSVHLKRRATLRRLVDGENGVVPAAVRILERYSELHAWSIAR